ncbi:hypothetical protein SAMN04489761_4289 [Tenacibaculum sp. MAR_2009_124]|uniref:hypothetical protein n=1 Tax=Tenacibaculum sp. MAR_2009_124 TaxID=1250059 RepID=UPI000894A882|nr:hypothetical protein [Tenacibaculum sp. MAR_2009_124]SED10506.1 hypothetical protein SAMN04489761_4289 [Tenacibaculum sp. MAR_2009_124]
MAELKQNTVTGESSLVSPSGQLATSANFIDAYTYGMVYNPDVKKDIHLQRGKGKLLPFCAITGSLLPFASDQVQHAELGELHQSHRDVMFNPVDSTFTTTSKHNLRSGEIIIISDGTIERQAVVDQITSETSFTGKNKQAGVFGFNGGLTISKFSNSWGKGEGNFTKGRRDTPEFKYNYAHIIKEFYDTPESDMAHHTWYETPGYGKGEGWNTTEVQRTIDSHANLEELTHLLHRRSDEASDATVAGYARGMKGIVQQIEEGGNIGNGVIEDIEELSDIAFRIKQQGGATAYSWWHDHKQSAAFRRMLASVNANYLNGGNYGMFNNSKETAIELGFKEVFIDGITFHSSELTTLDEPELLGSQKFRNTSVQSLMMPLGEANVLESGDQYSRPHLTIRYRQKNGINRYRKTKIFGGPYGTDHKRDTMEIHVESEMTNQVIGANQFFVFRRGNGIYLGN